MYTQNGSKGDMKASRGLESITLQPYVLSEPTQVTFSSIVIQVVVELQSKAGFPNQAAIFTTAQRSIRILYFRLCSNPLALPIDFPVPYIAFPGANASPRPQIPISLE